MKRLIALSLLLVGSFIYGYSKDDLEEAIEHSKLKKVKTILLNIRLTGEEKIGLCI